MAKRKKKITVTEAIVQWTGQELNAKTETQLRAAYKTLRATYGKRKKSFEKEGQFSYAIDRYEREFKKSPKIPVEKMRLPRLRREIAMLQHMFRGETATLAGAEEAYREQDARLFGTFPGTNVPNFRLSPELREAYWDAYDEWRSDQRIMGLALASSQEQSSLAEIMFGGPVKKKLFFDELDGTQEGEEYVQFTELAQADQGEALYNYLKSLKNVKERAEFMPNAYTGRGSDF